jgi:CheY-like chemotaxis protein
VNLLMVMADLFFASAIMDVAKKLGMKVELLGDKKTALERISSKPAAVIFDLNYAAADPIGIIQQIKTNAATRGIVTVGFVSHVQTDVKARAQNAGCDFVLARSVFVRKLPELLKPYAPIATARN